MCDSLLSNEIESAHEKAHSIAKVFKLLKLTQFRISGTTYYSEETRHLGAESINKLNNKQERVFGTNFECFCVLYSYFMRKRGICHIKRVNFYQSS